MNTKRAEQMTKIHESKMTLRRERAKSNGFKQQLTDAMAELRELERTLRTAEQKKNHFKVYT